ncbi:unnamed protein product, partial [Mesorhabditis belari]|uniref:Major facilitator superfamily (MFS) profile domain-containing protein n=1 Tax=Mesorhabditis belari TaxID=2138241 RepID=A0AAF3F8R2_9BILA
MYQNLLIVGTVRYAFNLLSAFAEYKLTWLGRKTTHRFFCVATMIALSISIAGQLLDAPEFLARIFLLTTAAIIIQLFAVLGIICNEAFPTALRNTAFAFTMFIESIGPILAPHLYSISGDRKWLPTVIMLASVSIDLIVFTLTIPETRGKPLVDKMPDNEKRFRLFRDKKVAATIESLEMT